MHAISPKLHYRNSKSADFESKTPACPNLQGYSKTGLGHFSPVFTYNLYIGFLSVSRILFVVTVTLGYTRDSDFETNSAR